MANIEQIERELRTVLGRVERLQWAARGVINLSSDTVTAQDEFTDLCSPQNIRTLLDELSRLREERAAALALAELRQAMLIEANAELEAYRADFLLGGGND